LEEIDDVRGFQWQRYRGVVEARSSVLGIGDVLPSLIGLSEFYSTHSPLFLGPLPKLLHRILTTTDDFTPHSLYSATEYLYSSMTHR